MLHAFKQQITGKVLGSKLRITTAWAELGLRRMILDTVAAHSIECVDFIWVKGDICIKEGEIFGDEKASDHFGIRATLDI